MDIKLNGTGLQPDPEDGRDYWFDPEVVGAAPIDWNNPPPRITTRNEDQGSSDGCGPYATSYYHETLRPGRNFSRRDLAARVLLPGYGSTLRDNALALLDGQATRDEVKDPDIPTSKNLRDKTGLKAEYRNSDKEQKAYAFDSKNIDTMATCVRDLQGALSGVVMTSEGWRDKVNPRPPKPGEAIDGHALYAVWYHLHDGQKCIVFQPSWCNSMQTKEHHIKEDYFKSGFTFNPWVIIPNSYMNQAQVVKSKFSEKVFVCYPVPSMEYLLSKSELEGFTLPEVFPDTDALK